MFVLALCLVLVSLNVCNAGVDRTREERAKGSDIVQAVVDSVRENCIYPNDRLFLRRLAYVESGDGSNLDTFRPNFYGGIWQVSESDFNLTKNAFLLREQYERIQKTLNIDWEHVQWRDLTKPLYSGLAASLVLQRRFGNNTPGVLDRQAEMWKIYYHPEKPTSYFIYHVQMLPVDDCQIDIGFILDESGSIGSTDFQVMLDFVKNVTDKFTIGPNAVEVALVTFDSSATVEFSFGTYSSHADLHSAIDNTRYNGGGTNTASGIRLAREAVFRNGSRHGSTKVALVITDGCSNSRQDTVREAKYAKAEGIVLFALGIGSICGTELEDMASAPNCTHVFYLTGFSDIDSLIYEIQKAACRAPVVIGPSQGGNANHTGNTGNPPVHTVITQTLSPNKTETKPIAVSTSTTNDTDIQHVMQVNVNCGIVHVYMSYDNPHPSSALYSDKLTATDGHPAVLSLEKTVDGRPLYMTFVGTQLPAEAAGLRNCSDAHFETTFMSVNASGTEIICRQNGHDRECTKLDFMLHEKYKNFLCSSSVGISESPVSNPCTEEAIRNNQLFHPHPYDYTKFIKCDYHHKMYITQCPQGERYYQGSHSCGSTASIDGDKTPLENGVTNPCNHQTVSNQEFFYAYSKDDSKFIHCDVWGNAWVMTCQGGLVWNQQSHACIEDTSHPDLSNPCTQEQLDRGITMFPHPDPHKYIHCDSGLNQWVQSCVPGTVFDFTTQNCAWENINLG